MFKTLVFIMCVATSCFSVDVQHIHQHKIETTTFEAEGHQWIFLMRVGYNNVYQFIHSPDCQCGKD